MAKIDTTQIQGYADMTPEQKLQALEAFEYDDHAGELDRMKNAVTKANGEAAEWKRKHNALLSEDEQRKQADADAIAGMQKELEDLRRDKLVSGHKASYLALGYDEALAADTAEALASGDMAKVFANQKKFQETLAKNFKADALKNTPRPGAGAPGGTDYDKLISEAQARGDITAVAYYTRLKAQDSAGTE